MAARPRLLVLTLLTLSLALPALLAGCGWEPLYANHETAAGSADLRAVQVSPIPERVGQILENGLRNSFNPDRVATKALYTLNVSLTTSLADLNIQSQGLGTRGEVQIVANYQLIELSTRKVLQTGFVHANDSFDIQANGYSTVVAQNDAKVRDVEEIRHEIVARLTMFMQSKQPAAS
jgi:LPS-assembly lipoprotein